MSDIEIVRIIQEDIGVTFDYEVNDYNNVISIDLSSKKIEKVPEKLCLLTELRSLDLSSNKFTSLSGLEKLSNVESVNLSSNTPKLWLIDSHIEELFRKAKKLVHFNFTNNLPLNTIPDWVLENGIDINSPFNLTKKGFSADFDSFAWFPPQQLLCLGYNNPEYYRDIKVFPEPYRIMDIDNIGKWQRDAIEKFIQKHIRSGNSGTEENFLRYYLKQFKILKFQEISKIDIKGIAPETKWIYLTGENGFGKTSILQALVISMFGSIGEFTQNIGVLCELETPDKAIVNIFTAIKNKNPQMYFTEDKPFEYFVAYGASRLNKSYKPQNSGKTYSLFNTDGVLLDIEQKMVEWEKDEEQVKYHDAAKRILLNLLSPQVENVKVFRDGPKTTVLYKETESIQWKPFEELASGYRSIIAMIGDMLIRLSETQPEIEDFSELAGIVIIDEFDLHLHPKWQKMLVEKLTDTFPHIQFIVSTHSPIPLLGAPKNSVVIKVDRDKEHGITAAKLDIDFTTLTPNSILTSPIFGFEEIYSDEADIEEVETADYYSDVVAEERLKEKLQVLKQNDEDFFKSLTKE